LPGVEGKAFSEPSLGIIAVAPMKIARAVIFDMVCVGLANANSGNLDLTGADLVLHDFSPESRLKVKRLVSGSSPL
jgi:hypothetical protein